MMIWSNIVSADLLKICSIRSLASAEVDLINTCDETVPTGNNIYTIKNYGDKTIFYR